MPRNPLALLAASGWSRDFDGTRVPDGAAAFAAERFPADGGAVLVLGAGAGHWPAALARSGRRVVVMDGSRVLLGEMRERFAASADLAAGVGFVHGDFRDFEPVEGAGSVLLPAPGLASFGTREERRALLACAAAQVRPGGAFLLHSAPLPPDLDTSEAHLRVEVPFEDPVDGSPLLRRTTIGRDGSGRPLVRHVFLTRKEREPAGECGLLLCPVDAGETHEDLESAGLAERERLGGFGGEPHRPGGPLVIVAGPKSLSQ